MSLKRWNMKVMVVFLLVFGLIVPTINATGGSGEVKHFAPAFPDPPFHFKGNGTFKLKSGEFDPPGDIPVLEIVSGNYSVWDCLFDYGKVIYDYLKQPETK